MNHHIITLKSALHSADLHHKRVFLRVDLNVPLKNGTIINDHRLTAIIPTIDLIQKKGGKIILATHIGRPSSYTAQLSTSLLIPWFEKHGYTIDYQADLTRAYEKSFEHNGTILLLENMRFFPGEKDGSDSFAHTLYRLADYYVNDAFGLLHRTDTSITKTAALFSPSNRTIGLLIEHELKMLNQLLEKPTKPFVLIIGGGKVADKLPLLHSFLDSVDTILLGPAIVFTFLKALNQEVGASLIDRASIPAAAEFLRAAQTKKVTVIMPIDYQIAHDNFHGPLSYVDAHDFPPTGVGISIGPKTIKLFTEKIIHAQTLFYNGLMGDATREETLTGAQAIFKAMAQSSGLSIIGGGDSVAVAQQADCAHAIRYLSTGGGATLTYLAGQNLPGLQSLQ